MISEKYFESFSRISRKNICLNLHAPNLKRLFFFPRMGGKVKLSLKVELLEMSNYFYSLKNNRIALSVLV